MMIVSDDPAHDPTEHRAFDGTAQRRGSPQGANPGCQARAGGGCLSRFARDGAKQPSCGGPDRDTLPGPAAAVVADDPSGQPAQNGASQGFGPQRLGFCRQQHGSQPCGEKQSVHWHDTGFDAATLVLFARTLAPLQRHVNDRPGVDFMPPPPVGRRALQRRVRDICLPGLGRVDEPTNQSQPLLPLNPPRVPPGPNRPAPQVDLARVTKPECPEGVASRMPWQALVSQGFKFKVSLCFCVGGAILNLPNDE